MNSSTSTTFPNACTWTFSNELFQCNIATSSSLRWQALTIVNSSMNFLPSEVTSQYKAVFEIIQRWFLFSDDSYSGSQARWQQHDNMAYVCMRNIFIHRWTLLPKRSDSSLAHCGIQRWFFPQARCTWQNECSPVNRMHMGAAVGVVHVVTIFVQRWMCSSTSTTFPNTCTWTFNDELFQCNIATSSRARGDKLWQL